MRRNVNARINGDVERTRMLNKLEHILNEDNQFEPFQYKYEPIQSTFMEEIRI